MTRKEKIESIIKELKNDKTTFSISLCLFKDDKGEALASERFLKEDVLDIFQTYGNKLNI